MSQRDIVANTPEPSTVETLAVQFAACGLQAGQVVIAHISLSSLGYVVGGPVVTVHS
jgi:aminoglycoside 3-N-acetyltransferase